MPSRELRELALAERVILLSKMQFASPSTRKFCRRWDGVCVADESFEVALALIGGKRTKQSISVLVNLVRFRLDASAGQDYACYVLAAKNSGLLALEGIKSTKLREKCLSELSIVQSDSKMNFADVNASYVCADTAFIDAHVSELASAIASGRVCNEEDF